MLNCYPLPGTFNSPVNRKHMKQAMPILAAVSLIAACKTKSDVNADAAKTAPATITTDTTGLSQYQAWKAQHELESTAHYNPQAVTAAPAQHITHTSTATHHTATTQSVQTQSSTMSSE